MKKKNWLTVLLRVIRFIAKIFLSKKEGKNGNNHPNDN